MLHDHTVSLARQKSVMQGRHRTCHTDSLNYHDMFTSENDAVGLLEMFTRKVVVRYYPGRHIRQERPR